MWPGVVGKGPGSEPFIDVDAMLRLTADADGVDLFLSRPHIDIDSTEDDVKKLADKIGGHKLVAGSLAAPVWPAASGGSAMGSDNDRGQFLTQVRKACAIGKKLRDVGIRPDGIVRINSASSPSDWAKDPAGNTKRIACSIVEAYGERLAAEAEICFGGMHGWTHMKELLEMVGRPRTIGFQADMAHTMLYALGCNSPESRLIPENFDWSRPEVVMHALRQVTQALRLWTIDFHVAQNDGTVKGSVRTIKRAGTARRTWQAGHREGSWPLDGR
jgi:hypothetical protein